MKGYKVDKYKQEGKAILTVVFWVVRFLAGILAINAATYKCTVKHVDFTLGAIVGYLVVAQVLYEVICMVRQTVVSDTNSKKK